MTTEGWITLLTITVAAILLASERLRPDVLGILVALTLGLTGVISAEEALSGFSQAAVITILSVFILSEGLERTGVTAWLGSRILLLAGAHERRLIGGLTLTSAGLSTFMNSIAAAAILVPPAMGISRKANIRPSRLLMPLAYGALLGGTATLLTTANIIVSTTLGQAGYAPYGLLDFLPVGLPLVIAGTGLLIWLAPRLLRQRDVASEIARVRRAQTELASLYDLETGASAFSVPSHSPVTGQSLGGLGWGRDLGLTVLGILHRGRWKLAPDREVRVQAEDVLLLEGRPTTDFIQRNQLEPYVDPRLLETIATAQVPLVEVVLAPRSELDGKSLREIRFRERYGIQVIGLWRAGAVLQEDLAEQPLHFGDAMLMQGPSEKFDLLRSDENFLILEAEAAGRPGWRAWVAVGIVVASLGCAALGLLPIAIATLTGAMLMVLSGCIQMDAAYRSISWRTIFFIAGMLPLSIALQTTGLADLLGEGLIGLTGGAGSLALATALLLATIGLGLLIGGQTTAVVLAPVAIAVAEIAGVDPRAMAMAVAVGCSLAFLTPLGHPANLLVMGPGGYTVRDYLRLGAPLTAVTALLTLLGLHWAWGL
ncbi:MAG: SLC13 family permease [Anaerolineales bacterium]|nr:SLC13 family permease [Anaerolineales bacterium]